MKTEETRAHVRQMYDAYIRGDAERFSQFLHDDIEWVLHAPIEVFPFAGLRKGKLAVLEALATIGDIYEMKRYEPQMMIVDGDSAAVLSEAGFVQRSSGRMLRFLIADFLRMRDGKVVEFREFTDTFDVTQQALGRFIKV